MTKLPEIKTDLPGPKSKQILEVCRRYESSALKTFKDGDPIVYESAEGAVISDPDGNTFIDIAGSYSATLIGHRPKKVVDVVMEQIKKSWHVPSDFPTEVRSKFLELLAKIVPRELNRTLFTITGSDANDAAVMLARTLKRTDDVIVFWGAYHGRGAVGATLGAEQAAKVTNPGSYLKPHFLPFPYCYRCAFSKNYPSCELACLEFLKQTLENPMSGASTPCAIVFEPVQGHAGSVPAPQGYIKGLRDLCDQFGIVLVVDEVQTGFGRTGKMWAVEHDSVVPDIMTIGKGLGGGLPVAAVVGKDELMMQWKAGNYTRTLLTNAVSLAAATGAIEVMINDGLQHVAKEKGQYFLIQLKEKIGDIKIVGDIRGLGLLLGIELVNDRSTKEPARDLAKRIVKRLKYRGILTVTSGYYGNVIKISPPIAIEKEQINYFVNVLAQELSKNNK